MTTTAADRPTRAGWGTCALVAALALAGCGSAGDGGEGGEGGDPGTGSGPVGQGTTDTVEATFDVDVDVAPSDTAVSVRYEWTNESDEAVLVVDRPTARVGASTRPSPEAWYAVGVGDGVVQVSQRLFERPVDAPDAAQEIPVGMTQVAPGATLDGSLEVPLPIVEATPYDGRHAPGEGPVGDPTSVQFCLGVLVPPYDPRLVDRTDDGVIGYHGSTELQTLFCSDPVGL